MSTLPVPASPSNFLAWAAAQSTIRDVQDLVAGNGPFQQMSVEERAEMLQQVIGALEGCEPLIFPGLKKVDDRCLSWLVSDPTTTEPMLREAVAELTRRVSAPTPDERDEIEQRIEADGDFQDAERWDCCT